MGATEVLADANVALKWFHSEGEEGVGDSRTLLEARRSGEIALALLDLTIYEVGNALIRGAANRSAAQAATVLHALRLTAEVLTPTEAQMELALTLASDHDLTVYDSTYAAVAQSRHRSALATFDGALLKAGLGSRPGEILA